MSWFTAKAREDNPRHGHVVIDRPIGSDWAPDWIADFTAQKAARELIAAVEALGELDEITVEINSPGGDVASGVRIYNYLRDHAAKIHTRVTGMAASIATIIMMAGEKRSMAKGTNMMTHRASALLRGAYDVSSLKEVTNNLSSVDSSLVDIYVEATGKSKKEIEELLDKGDTYLTAEEAIEWGFATEADQELRAVACADPSLFMRQLDQESEIHRLRAAAEAHGKAGSTMTAVEALALAFDMSPEEVEAQAADLGDKIIEMRSADSTAAKAAVECVAKALGLEVQAVLDKPQAAVDALNAKVNEAGDIAVNGERERSVAIIKACQTTGQNQLLEKLIAGGDEEKRAVERIMDVASAADPRIHNSHSPEGGHQPVISTTAIYNRRKSKVTN